MGSNMIWVCDHRRAHSGRNCAHSRPRLNLGHNVVKPSKNSLDVHAARGTFLFEVTFEVLGHRGSLQIPCEGNTSPNGPQSESQPTGVNGRPRRVFKLGEDDDNEGWTVPLKFAGLMLPLRENLHGRSMNASWSGQHEASHGVSGQCHRPWADEYLPQLM
jgi:hypothetical protein